MRQCLQNSKGQILTCTASHLALTFALQSNLASLNSSCVVLCAQCLEGAGEGINWMARMHHEGME